MAAWFNPLSQKRDTTFNFTHEFQNESREIFEEGEANSAEFHLPKRSLKVLITFCRDDIPNILRSAHHRFGR